MAVPNIGDVLNCFPSLNICPTFLITQLPILQPRYYSISSSAEASPGEIDVTVKVLQYRTGSKK
jgi:sulfite reductase alpha subunit-like flavoprotein